jgi:hypothetical protein
MHLWSRLCSWFFVSSELDDVAFTMAPLGYQQSLILDASVDFIQQYLRKIVLLQ